MPINISYNLYMCVYLYIYIYTYPYMYLCARDVQHIQRSTIIGKILSFTNSKQYRRDHCERID